KAAREHLERSRQPTAEAPFRCRDENSRRTQADEQVRHGLVAEPNGCCPESAEREEDSECAGDEVPGETAQPPYRVTLGPDVQERSCRAYREKNRVPADGRATPLWPECE